MLVFVMSGLAFVVTVMTVMARLSIRRWLGYPFVLEISFTLLAFTVFFGTFGGMVSASIAGIAFTVALQMLRACLGYETLKLKRVRWYRGWYRLHWVAYPSSIQRFTCGNAKARAT